MNPNNLFLGKGINPEQVLVLRHRPSERELNKVLPWLAAERPERQSISNRLKGGTALHLNAGL